MTASERVRAAREEKYYCEDCEDGRDHEIHKPKLSVTFYAPAQCYCLRCRILRFTRP